MKLNEKNKIIKEYKNECKRYEHEIAFCLRANVLLDKYIDIISEHNVKCSFQFTNDLSMVFSLKSKGSTIYIEQYFDKATHNFIDEVFISKADKNKIVFYGSTRLDNLSYELKEIFKN